MSNWVSNGPCPNCGSKDNLATYDDGHQWCWGCGYHVQGDKLYAVRHLRDSQSAPEAKVVVLPHDVDTNYPHEVILWLANYELTRSDLLANRVLWSDSSRLLIFSLTDGEGRVVAWQGRNFGTKYRTKWYGRGVLEDTFIFLPRNTKRAARIIFVEDILSAIKLGKVIEECNLPWKVMPIFGSHVAKRRLSRCLLFLNDPPQVVFWLDKDKAKESILFRKNAQSLGFVAYSQITEKDPKEISFVELKELCNNALL